MTLHITDIAPAGGDWFVVVSRTRRDGSRYGESANPRGHEDRRRRAEQPLAH